ncbi:xaa-Pro dipeptidase isoform X2 [Diabrotica virgifera virgifera]|uniref:Xaa-Pro dipeptidase n=1 Tax=Diabrotica virgifera virgifera TaxID=50390 RepID=A0A6P7G630_DIAVI|nr:xaa-Pro dipeptidase isoform X2 [Diabrotica virgifera virgifera]
MANKHVGKLSMGAHTFEIPPILYETNRKRLVERLKKDIANSVVVLQGGSEVSIYDSDTTYLFRQEAYFNWCFGVAEPDCYGIIDVVTGDSHLFFPRLPVEYAVWMGPLTPLDEFKKKYKSHHVHYVDELKQVLENLNRETLLTLSGVNSDSGLTAKTATFEGIEKFKVNNKALFPIIADLRVIKTSYELDVLKYVTEVSSAAHRHVMRFAKAGTFEYQCESEFLNHCYKHGGCRHVAYTCICGSGINGAVLHYGHAGAPNNFQLEDGKLCLFDMGGEYYGYAADITVTFPVNGKFSPQQKIVYEAVLKSNEAVLKAGKPGVSWTDMHLLANRVLLEELKKGGLLQGSVDDMIAADIAPIFQPHGLGHFVGLNVHDVGGYLEGNPERPTKPGLKSLRTARILEKNMVLTIEPGCYFINILLDNALADPIKSKFLVADVINTYRNFGGVRIEDDVVVTEDGIKNLTKVPRTVQEIEDWIAGTDDDKKYS